MAQQVVILGGTGKMGRWFAKFLKDKGFEVAIHSRTPAKAAKVAEKLNIDYITNLDAVRDADMVIVSVSLDSTAETIRAISMKMKPNAILFDIASVKGDILQALDEARVLGVRAISVHPMFGPGATSLKGKHVIIIPVGDDVELVDEITSLFEGAETHIIGSGDTHDKMVALTLSLPHFLNMVFGKMLPNKDIREITKLAGTTFSLQLVVTEAVHSEDPDLYFEIQNRNSAFKNVLDTFLESAKEVASAVKENDRSAFVKSFKEVRSILSRIPTFPELMTDSIKPMRPSNINIVVGINSN